MDVWVTLPALRGASAGQVRYSAEELAEGCRAVVCDVARVAGMPLEALFVRGGVLQYRYVPSNASVVPSGTGVDVLAEASNVTCAAPSAADCADVAAAVAAARAAGLVRRRELQASSAGGLVTVYGPAASYNVVIRPYSATAQVRPRPSSRAPARCLRVPCRRPFVATLGSWEAYPRDVCACRSAPHLPPPRYPPNPAGGRAGRP